MGTGSKYHDDLIEVASLGFLRAYLDEPQAWYAHNYRYPISVIYSIVTNSPLKKSTEELADLQKVTSTFLTSINSSPVDFFPQVARIPNFLQFWRSHWEKMGIFHYTVFKQWWEEMLSLNSPNLRPSFVFDSVLKDFSGTTEQAMYLTMFILAAGADNPRMTMNSGIMACMAYPAVMNKARYELDQVCGDNAGRLPGLKDLPQLPYVCAVVKEILRWRPTVPLIPQRVLVKDMELEGYRFPAGTEFLVNSTAVCANGYEKPHEFYPDRWLDTEKSGCDVKQDLWQYAFSAGKRSCVGYKLAQKEMLVVFARLLYCFNFVHAGDLDDTKLNAFAPGEPFAVKVTARSPLHEQLIRNEAVVCDMWEAR
ncbi:Cytochrome P450 monooxygenase yanC-like protein [Cladobotryum mycophilum]|uniref:Cytochrome P450 monooxygenase yanC-like protein n=1 Tax=Cladobotryum mycophilum TaxID=491253 RepID=A0ABR0SBL6_9HYPO